MEQNEYELIVSEGRLPIWRIIIAALFFTYMLYMLYYVCIMFYTIGFNEETFGAFGKSAEGIFFTLAGGISFSVTKTIKIDVDLNKLVSIYSVGPFFKKVLSEVPKLEYVSVFLNSKGEYEVNIWYNGNKHYNMYNFYEKKPALKLAVLSATKLNLDVLDATVKGNPEWLEKSEI